MLLREKHDGAFQDNDIPQRISNITVCNQPCTEAAWFAAPFPQPRASR